MFIAKSAITKRLIEYMVTITKTCRQSPQHQFVISDEDQKFYEKLGVPPPSLCPDCRQQRRLAWRNERKLYNRKDLTGKQIISLFSPDKKTKVYDTHEWWKDAWDARGYGRPYDFSRPFFEQFEELLKDVPDIALMNDDGTTSENCAYTSDFAYSKNCYLCFVTWYNEDCYYSTGIHYSKNTVDCLDTMKSELAYECIDCDNCYHCFFLQYCDQCSDCFFGYDLKNCNHCFKCHGLRHKEYYIENKPYSKEEYQRIVSRIFFSSHINIKKLKEEYTSFRLQQSHKNVFQTNCENCIGNKLSNCKNIIGFECYGCIDAKYLYHCAPLKDCYDLTNTGRAELCYETLVSNDGYRSLFTNECWNSKDAHYCSHCFHCEAVFGCAGLRKQKYCILNKQYTKEEYEKLVPRIIEHMKQTGEWGEFFPISLSPFGYNETVADEYFPLTKEQALQLGAKWHEQDLTNRYEGPTMQIPDTIKEVQDDITKEILTCESCQRNYKIIIQELRFYRDMGLPVPKDCPDCRHKARLALRNPRRLWDRQCMKCGTDIKTSYAPDRKEIVYCEKCYNKTIY